MHTNAAVAAEVLYFDKLPDFDVFDTASWAVQDTLDRVTEGV